MDTKSKFIYKSQVLSALCVNLLTLSYGTSIGWISPTLLILEDPKTPLESGLLSIQEVSLLGSTICAGGLFGSLIYGWIADRIGRKNALLTLGIPQFIGWILVYFAKNANYLIASRILHGFAGGGSKIVASLFITEISNKNIRGRLGALTTFTINLGILIAYIICAYVDYHISCICLFMITVFFYIGIIFVQESPIFLLKKKKMKQAVEALKFYNYDLRYADVETKKRVENEYEEMKSLIFNPDSGEENKMKMSDFFTKAAIKSIIIGLALMFFAVFSGSFALLSYASMLFKESGSTLSPNNSAIAVGVLQLIGVYISITLVDRAGRKVLLLISSSCCALGLSAFSFYDYFRDLNVDVSRFSFVPILSFAFVIVTANFGLLMLPMVIIPEVLPMKIKSFMYSFIMSFSWILSFLSLVLLPLSIDAVGIYGTIGMFAVICFTAIGFIAIYIPETKNKTIEEIQEIMSK